MTTRVWNTQRPTGEGALLRSALSAVVIPDLSLSPFRASFAAVNELSASITATFSAVAERIEVEYKRAAEGFRAAYKAMPRAVRRSLGKQKRATADRSSKAWPGTDALTPDHPTRVIYKRLLSHTDISSLVLDRALERCSDADERAHRNTDAVTVEVQAVTVEVEPAETDAPERIEHTPGAPQLLLAVTSSRNAPADSHARTVNSTQTMQGRHTLRKA